MKKKKDKLKETIIKKEKKENFKMLTNVLLLIVGIVLLSLKLMRGYLYTNEILINKILFNILLGFEFLFANMLWIVIITMLVVSLSNIILRNSKYRYGKLKKYLYITIFILISITIIATETKEALPNDIIMAGQELLEKAFSFKAGSGLIGVLPSILLYKILHLNNTIYILLLIITILTIILFKDIISLLYEMFVETNNYYNSPEYKKKLKVLEAKKAWEKKEKHKEDQKIRDNFKNYIINQTETKLDEEIYKKNDKKDEYYSEEEIKQVQDKWLMYLKEIDDNKKEKLEQEKLEKEKALLSQIEESNKKWNASKDNLNEEIEIEPEAIEEEIYIPEIEDIKEEEKPEEVEEVRKELQVELEEKDNKIENKIEENTLNIEEKIEEIFEYKALDEDKKEEIKQMITNNINHLENILKNFGVEAKVVDYATGPRITRYEIKIPQGVRVNKVTQLTDEIAMNLAAESIRIEAPIPGKSTIGIEVPNKIKESVHFSNIIINADFNEGDLPVILGKDIVGRDKIIDIAKMPHLLIAGQTGSGKSVAINTILSTLISKKTADEVKLILVDPKMVELLPYNDIPHLLLPVIIKAEQAAIALKWAVNEMETRYEKLAELRVKNIQIHNKKFPNDKMPFIVIIIDELADLMMTSASTVETSIARIAQKARAVGIHLVVATQRPSTDVITGMIKANLPSRISFALRTQIDSRTILDQAGAEKLLGAGDMLILESGKSKLERIQGAFISDDEVNKLTDILKKNYKVNYNNQILEYQDEESEDIDPYYDKALLFIESEDGKISISGLQGELKIGFNRAKRLYNTLKKNGIIDENNQVI